VNRRVKGRVKEMVKVTKAHGEQASMADRRPSKVLRITGDNKPTDLLGKQDLDDSTRR
jgi:hypothetical protein